MLQVCLCFSRHNAPYSILAGIYMALLIIIRIIYTQNPIPTTIIITIIIIIDYYYYSYY